MKIKKLVVYKLAGVPSGKLDWRDLWIKVRNAYGASTVEQVQLTPDIRHMIKREIRRVYG